MDDPQVEVGLLSTRVKDSKCECAITGGQKNTTAVNMLKFYSKDDKLEAGGKTKKMVRNNKQYPM